MRTGSDYLRSLNDGRQVFVEGERVKDVTKHRAFREAARSIARLYDIAAAPEMRERMTFVSPKTGEPVDVPAKRVPYFKPGKELKEYFTESPAAAEGAVAATAAPEPAVAAGESAMPRETNDGRA